MTYDKLYYAIAQIRGQLWPTNSRFFMTYCNDLESFYYGGTYIDRVFTVSQVELCKQSEYTKIIQRHGAWKSSHKNSTASPQYTTN